MCYIAIRFNMRINLMKPIKICHSITHSIFRFLIDLRNGVPNDNFGASFIFERALKRMDVQTEQRRLQQEKFESLLKNADNDNKMLELRLTNKDKDIEKANEKFKNLQVFFLKNITQNYCI